MKLEIFGNNTMSFNGVIRQGYNLAKAEQIQIERVQAQKMQAYYERDKLAIWYFLRHHLSTLVQNQESLDRIRPVIINFVPKIMKKLCQVYARPVSFKLDSEEEQKIYDMQFATAMHDSRKEFHKRGKLFNTILVRPIWHEDTKEFEFMILHKGICKIKDSDNNYNKLLQVSYLIEENEKEYEIVWTDDEHYAIDTETDKRVELEGIDGTNHYRKIPFIVLRFEKCSDFWGDGLSDLVDMNESICGAMSDAYYKRYLNFGVPVAIDCDLKKEKVIIAPDSGIVAETRPDGNRPSFEFVTPNQGIDTDIKLIEWGKNSLAMAHGLPADSFSTNPIAESGYSKMISSLELLANNEDDEAALRIFEYRLWDMLKTVLQTDSRTIKLKSNIISIEFNGMEFPLTTAEINAKREFAYKYNMESPVDWLKTERPDLTVDELKQILAENESIKKTLVEPKAVNRIETILNQNAQ